MILVRTFVTVALGIKAFVKRNVVEVLVGIKLPCFSSTVQHPGSCLVCRHQIGKLFLTVSFTQKDNFLASICPNELLRQKEGMRIDMTRKQESSLPMIGTTTYRLEERPKDQKG